MNIMYFTMKNLNENRAFLAMLGFLFVFSCAKDKGERNGNGNGNGEPTPPTVIKPTLTITKPTGGNITSDVGDINCGSKGNDCEAEFDKVVEVTLTAKSDTGYALGDWQGACDKTKATERACKLVMDADKTASRAFLVDTDKDGDPDITDPDDDGDEVLDTNDVDSDGDGLIEIHNLDMFNHIRYNLAGTTYKAGSSATASILGAPASLTANCKTASGGVYLCGYELMRDLDFNEDSSYATGSTNKSVWQPNNSDSSMATNAGFVGIDSGFGGDDFAGIFEGNGYTISNLYSRNTDDMSPGDGTDGSPIARVGLFKSTEAKATIRNLGVVDARLYGSASDNEQIGSLVSKNKGTILACHATGEANGGDGVDTIGGLVGVNTAGTGTAAGAITDSHATVAVDGGAGNDRVGGLVGRNKGSIRDSYVTGAVNGGTGKDRVGGLVGRNNYNIIASYATGVVNGGGGDDDHVGGLVGSNDANIIASFATGAVNGGAGDDYVGGLVGRNYNDIIASSATGNVSGSFCIGGLVGFNQDSIIASSATGNVSGRFYIGGLVGYNEGNITASYATGNASGGGGDQDAVGGLVGRNYPLIDWDGTIASYATGNTDGGSGSHDKVNGLLGLDRRNKFKFSYSFGIASNGNKNKGSSGTVHPVGLNSISGKANKVNALTAPGGGANTDMDDRWNDADQKTLNAWDFGTDSQAPALKYADYDGAGFGTDYCALFPAKIPGTDTDLECGVSLLPNQPGR